MLERLLGAGVLWALAAGLPACGDDGSSGDSGNDEASDEDDGAADADADADTDGDDDEVETDGSGACVVPADCQDGVFCNGDEACAPGTAGADARGCVAGTPPCTDVCDETARNCTPARCEALPAACGTNADCDDGVTCNGAETCDAAGLCRPGTPVECSAGRRCLESTGACNCSLDADCDDGLHCNGAESCASGLCLPGTPPCDASRCIEAENACSCTDAGQCDDGLYCNGLEFCNTSTSRCELFAISCSSGDTCLEGRNRCAAACTSAADCDDGLAATGTEVCVDGRCQTDADGDGHSSAATGGDDCDDADRRRYLLARELCDPDNLDEDCNPRTFDDPSFPQDADGDGFVAASCCNVGWVGDWWCGNDCDDHRPSTNPIAVEACNGYDDDCNGVVDDGVLAAQFRDRDGDGDGDPGCGSMQCPGTAGWAATGTDCDDTRATVRGGTSVCNPDGVGVSTCTGGTWASAPCPAGTSCRPQPGGAGLCL